MIRLHIKIKSLNGETFINDEELDNDYMVSRQNPEFIKLIENNMGTSHFEEIDTIKVTAYFGEI